MRKTKQLIYFLLCIVGSMNIVYLQGQCPDITGTVFLDFNQDGVKDSAEPGFSTASVNAYDDSGTAFPGTVNGDGTYSITGIDASANTYRVEFSWAEPWLKSGAFGGTSATSVQFVGSGTCTADFGVGNPQDYCSTDPPVAVPCFTNGDYLGNTTDALVSFTWSQSGRTPTVSHDGTVEQLGAVWGTAYDRINKKNYSAAFLKRHSNTGSGGLGGIYLTDYSLATPATSGTPLIIISNVGTIPDRGLTGVSQTTPNRDHDAFANVGKLGLGGLEVSNDGNTLWAVNLFEKSIVPVDVSGASAVEGTSIAIPNPGCSGNSSDWRPFALKYYQNSLFVGGVCNGDDGGVSTMRMYVYQYDLTTNSWANSGAAILDESLQYQRESGFKPTSGCDLWKPWINQWSEVGYLENDGDHCHPQPMFSDIEFDIDGDMILLFMDRIGHQSGRSNYCPDDCGSDAPNFNSVIGGEILRADYDGSSFILESDGKIGSNGCGSVADPEYYCGDEFIVDPITHAETIQGSGAILFGSGEIITTAMDPIVIVSGGMQFLNNLSGMSTDQIELYETGYELSGTFAKANGLGEVDLLCPPSPIEIGNRLWIDADSDGIQDPSEVPVSGILVGLYDGTGTQIATATTDGTGHYLFTSAAVADLTYGDSYFVVVEDYSSGTGLTFSGADYDLTSNDTDSDQRDSDGTIASGVGSFDGKPYVPVSTGNPGDNDHTYDFGFRPASACNTSITAIPSACDAATNTYTLDGVITVDTPPATGTMTVSNSGGGTQVFEAPFTSPINYSILNNFSNGLSQTATVIFSDSADCFATIDYTAPISCSTAPGCYCEEMIYLNEPSTGGAIHKFIVSPDGSLVEVGQPWFDNAVEGEQMLSPHGLGTDINGYMYIGETASGDIRKFMCDGSILPESEFVITDGGTNIASIGNTLYVNSMGAEPDGIYAYDLCSGNTTGYICLEGLLTAEGGIFGDSDWGFSIVNETTFLITDSYFNGSKNNLWVFDIEDVVINDPASTSPVCIDPLITEDDGILNPGDQEFIGNQPYGVTLDNFGNIYVVESVFSLAPSPTFPSSSARISKFDNTGAYIMSSDWDTVEGDGGYFKATGIVFSETSGMLYISTQSPFDDCAAMMDPTTMTYLGPAVPSAGTGDFAKGIAIKTECCPINTTTSLDIVVCDVIIGEQAFLQDLIGCGPGGICEGMWTPADGNTGFTYNECNSTVTVDAADACGSFILESDGTGPGSQCGPFIYELNVQSIIIQDNEIVADQTLCPSDTPAMLTSTANVSVGTLTYQWQMSTTSCEVGFENIGGATELNYSPDPISQTTYFRMVSTVEGICASGSCSSNSNCITLTLGTECCSITAAGEANLACEDNDTGSDGTDDFLTIDLNPVGTEIGTNYNVSVSSGTIAPATAAYGAATTFTLTGDLSAAADIVITITDDTDADCQFPLTITDPAPCSTPDPCSITAAGEANLACDDNDTGSDGTDDFLTIDLNPTGSMLGTNYSVAVSSGTIAPATAAYGATTTFTITDDLSAAADIVITITDDVTGTCQFLLTITDPAPCSTPDPCSITAAGEANLACDDNDTGSDGTDDFLTIDLNPTGSMLGTNYSVSVSSGTIAPATAAYGAATSFTITDDLSAAADIVITITDDVTGTCQFLLTITDPAPCSTPQPCSITAAGEANLACDDNDTGSDDTDDFLTIDLNPTGSMLGTNYSVSVSSGTIAPATAAYGAATTFTITDDLSAATDIVITITDDVTGTCQFLLTITDPAPCSTPQPCSITAAGEANLACDDNDTGSDDTDDFLTIDLNPTGSMLGTNYSVSVSSGTIAPATAAYGAATSFTITDDLSAAADIVITITDDVTGTCQFLLTITDPAPCSTPQPCSITAAGEANLACDDNDTGSDDTDDFLTIDLNPMGSMLGTNYSVSVSSGTIAPATAAYGAATTFTITDDLTAAADIVITITDDTDGNCSYMLTLTDPEPCSTVVPCPDVEYELCAGAGESYSLTVETGVTDIQWFLDGSPIDPADGGNDPTLIATVAGTYHYTATGLDGCDGELCCPFVLVEIDCCAAPVCMPGTMVKN